MTRDPFVSGKSVIDMTPGKGEEEPREVTDAEKLAAAVVLFYSAGPWDDRKRATWEKLTGTKEATTKHLGDLAWKVLKESKT